MTRIKTRILRGRFRVRAPAVHEFMDPGASGVDEGVPELDLLIRPNRSLPPQGIALVFAGIAFVCTTVAVAWATAGAWLVLPFFGLEIVVAGAALWTLHRAAGDFEQFVIRGDRLVVTRCAARTVSTHEFQASWARLVERDKGWSERRLLIRSHGRELEIGAALDAEGRQALARQLRGRLGAGYR